MHNLKIKLFIVFYSIFIENVGNVLLLINMKSFVEIVATSNYLHAPIADVHIKLWIDGGFVEVSVREEENKIPDILMAHSGLSR